MVIYSILNKINLKRYIGSAVKFNRRKNYHISKLRNGNHDNSYLQNSWNKYGESNFEFLILEKLDTEENLIPREQWWIDNTPSQYNICKIAGNCAGRKHTEEAKRKIAFYNTHLKTYSEETRKKISDSKRGVKRDVSKWNRKYVPKKVYEYSSSNKFVKEWKSVKDFAEFYKLAKSHVWNCANKNKQLEKLRVILSFIKY
jgi:group I intron endonuclease